jgi:AraC-like DNA-binding protein
VPNKISRDNIKFLGSGVKNAGADSWRNVSTMSQESIRYTISSLSMWTSLSAKVVYASCDQPFYSFDEADCSRLVMMLTPKKSGVIIGPHRNRRPTPTHDTPYQMTLSAPGARQYGFFDQPANHLRWLVLQFDVNLLGQHLGEGFRTSDFHPRFMFFDHNLYQIAKLFEAACLGDEPPDTLRDDLLLLALLNSLARIERSFVDKSYGLSQAERRLLIDYMRTRLIETIRLSELCNLVQLSPFHFCRSFKNSLGVSPHAWQMRERIRVAQIMMRDGRTQLADVAVAVGFYDQAHFTKSFKKIVGLPPGAWQKVL